MLQKWYEPDFKRIYTFNSDNLGISLFVKRKIFRRIFLFGRSLAVKRITLLREDDGMENNEQRVCPVCGEKVVGRKDKKYCCDCCRSAAGNRRQRQLREIRMKNRFVPGIQKDLGALCGERGERYLKIIAAVTLFCKIIYKFGHQNKNV